MDSHHEKEKEKNKDPHFNRGTLPLGKLVCCSSKESVHILDGKLICDKCFSPNHFFTCRDCGNLLELPDAIIMGWCCWKCSGQEHCFSIEDAMAQKCKICYSNFLGREDCCNSCGSEKDLKNVTHDVEGNVKNIKICSECFRTEYF